MDDLLAEFLIETRENIDGMNAALTALAARPADRDALQDLFRRMHTVKASCGFVRQQDIEAIAHKADNLLIRLYESEESPGPAHLQTLGESVRRIKAMAEALAADTPAKSTGDAWTRLPLVAADAAARLGKMIAIEIHGRETPVEPALLGALLPPLLHLVRNAADHGIETPQVRRQAGKPETGTIAITIARTAGALRIEITDDGAGLQTEKIRLRALESGLKTERQLAAMSEQDLFGCIFIPGFSTSETVTALSGHGMGMDVVRNNIEKSGGSIAVQSTAGAGCSFIINIPAPV